MEEQIIQKLSSAKVGDVVEVENGIKIKVRRSFSKGPNNIGCKLCFYRGDPRSKCNLMFSCMAHKRKDRESVIFKEEL